MSSPSRVETIFFAALEKKTAEERADYLDRACGSDAALRRRVERLLDAHPQAEDFLARPAVDRDDFDPPHAAGDATSVGPANGSEASPWDPGAGAGAGQTWIKGQDLDKGSGAKSTNVVAEKRRLRGPGRGDRDGDIPKSP